MYIFLSTSPFSLGYFFLSSQLWYLLAIRGSSLWYHSLAEEWDPLQVPYCLSSEFGLRTSSPRVTLSLLEVQYLRPYSGLTDSESPFNKVPRWFLRILKFRKHPSICQPQCILRLSHLCIKTQQNSFWQSCFLLSRDFSAECLSSLVHTFVWRSWRLVAASRALLRGRWSCFNGVFPSPI